MDTGAVIGKYGPKFINIEWRGFPEDHFCLRPTKEEDALRFAASNILQSRRSIWVSHFSVQEVNTNDVVYAVYSSQKYDMALMGWRLSEYPAYVCEWFGEENLFLYNSDRFKSTCDALWDRIQFRHSAAGSRPGRNNINI